MKIRKLVTSIGLTVSSVLFVSNSAQAASFTSNVTQNNGTKGDVLLNSITQNGKTFSNFSYVESVNSFSNTNYTGGNSGAASTDKGDLVKGLKTNEDPTKGEIANFLGDNNLNRIIDGEGRTFSMDLKFDSLIAKDKTGLDSLFFWERGMNSDLTIQGLDDEGNLIGNVMRLNRKSKKGSTQEDAGFKINTMEIGGAQQVGSWGVSLADLGVNNLRGVRLSADRSHGGPDFKVIARKSSGRNFAQAAKVPEPGTIIGLGSVAALAFMRRRKSK
ncbi:MAG: exosortase-dependent surface protein XDP2 [Cyanobacteria bacterium P01_A01_bin.68]